MDTVKDLAQIYMNLTLAQAGSRAAKKAAKGYAGVKVAKAGGRKLPGAVLASAAIAGLVAFLRKRNRQPPGYQPAPSTANPSSVPPAEPTAPAATGAPPSGAAGAPKSGTTTAAAEERAESSPEAVGGDSGAGPDQA
jgi:hypothetical protein